MHLMDHEHKHCRSNFSCCTIMVINYDNYQFMLQHLQILSKRWFYHIYNELLLIFLPHISSILNAFIYSYVLFTLVNLIKYWRKAVALFNHWSLRLKYLQFFFQTFNKIFHIVKQECFPVGCVSPALYHLGGLCPRGSLSERPPRRNMQPEIETPP